MTADQSQEEADGELFAFEMRFLPNYLSHTFYNARQEAIGTLCARNSGQAQWTPGKGNISYSLTIQELDDIIQAHCSDPERQSARDDYHVEYVPAFSERAIRPEHLSSEQREKLMQLNRRLSDMEEKLVRELSMRLDMLKKVDAGNPDGLIQYCWCDIKLDYLVGKNDPHFDEENSGNSLVERELSFCQIKSHYRSRVEEGINWNEFENWNDHPMRDEVHCYLYHDLYDHAHLGWANMLRIEDILVNVAIRLDEWGERIVDNE